jgi:hypothetical protein
LSRPVLSWRCCTTGECAVIIKNSTPCGSCIHGRAIVMGSTPCAVIHPWVFRSCELDAVHGFHASTGVQS